MSKQLLRVTTFGCWVLALAISLSASSAAAQSSRDESIYAALAQARLFASLTEPERKALHEATRIVHGKAGERVIEQGKLMNRMLLVLQGKAEVRVNGKTLLTLSDQPLLGEIEFLDGLPASADVYLLNDTDMVELDNAKLNRIFEKQPRMGYVLMREVAKIESRRLRSTSNLSLTTPPRKP